MGLVVSMTGYGRAEARGARVGVVAEARSLNHRFFEASVKLPRGLTGHEVELRRLVQSRVARGRVDVTVTLRRVESAGLTPARRCVTIAARIGRPGVAALRCHPGCARAQAFLHKLCS